MRLTFSRTLGTVDVRRKLWKEAYRLLARHFKQRGELFEEEHAGRESQRFVEFE